MPTNKDIMCTQGIYSNKSTYSSLFNSHAFSDLFSTEKPAIPYLLEGKRGNVLGQRRYSFVVRRVGYNSEREVL